MMPWCTNNLMKTRKTQADTSAKEEMDESKPARKPDTKLSYTTADGKYEEIDIGGFSNKKRSAFHEWRVNYDMDVEANRNPALRLVNRRSSKEKLTSGERGLATQGSQPKENDSKSSSDGDDSKSLSSSSPSNSTSSSVESVSRGAAANRG